MKISVFYDNQEQRVNTDLYLARHKKTGALAIFGRYSGILIEAETFGTRRGDGYSSSDFKKIANEDYTPLPLGTKVTLENEAADK